MNFRFIITVLFCCTMLSVKATTTPAPLTVELFANKSSYAAGADVELAAKIKIPPGWHVQSHEPSFDFLIGTTLTINAPGTEVTAIKYPVGKSKRFHFANNKTLAVYDGTLVVVAHLKLPRLSQQDALPARASVRYQACDDRVCLPPATLDAMIRLPLQGPGKDINQAIFANMAPASRGTALTTTAALVLLAAFVIVRRGRKKTVTSPVK